MTTARHRRRGGSEDRRENAGGGGGGGEGGGGGLREEGEVEEGGRGSRNPVGGEPDPSKCLLMFHGKGADFIGALMGPCH